MIEITGEVDQKERSQMMRLGVVKPDPKKFTHIPVFRLRVLTPSGRLVQVFIRANHQATLILGSRWSLRV